MAIHSRVSSNITRSGKTIEGKNKRAETPGAALPVITAIDERQKALTCNYESFGSNSCCHDDA